MQCEKKKLMKRVKLLIMRKCKSFSMELAKPSPSPPPYTNLRSNSTREHHKLQHQEDQANQVDQETVFVGSARKRYAIGSKQLAHPLLRVLMEKKKKETLMDQESKSKHEEVILVNCEVVLFDHLLWIIDNEDPNLSSESLEELAGFYVS